MYLGEPGAIAVTATALRLERGATIALSIPLDDVVGFNISDDAVRIVTYRFDRRALGFSRVHEEYRLTPLEEGDGTLAQWARDFRNTLIPGFDTVHTYVFVNPFGGTKKGWMLWETIVAPVLELCQVPFTVIKTERANHCRELVQSLRLHTGDVIACLSGDGLVNEALNGLMLREGDRPSGEFTLCHLPGGTSNGLAATLCTPLLKDAAYALCRRHTVAFDVFRCIIDSVKTGTQRVHFGFLTLTHSIIADIDIESEQWRWMGAARMNLKGAQKVLQMPHFPVKMEVEAPQPRHRAPCEKTRSCIGCHHRSPSGAQPMVNKDGDYIYLVISNVTHIGQTFHAAPNAHLCDGMLEVQLLPHPKGGLFRRIAFGTFLDNIGSGKHTTDPNLQCFRTPKVSLTPSGGRLVLDGEEIECAHVVVEVMPAHIHVVIPTPSHCLRWQPDWETKVCNGCRVTFGLLNSRHHCRKCGLVFDDACCPANASGVRVCKKCVKVVMESTTRA